MADLNKYNADSIKVLDDVSHIRIRRGMYIGDAIDPRQLLSEIFDNAIDEVQAGFSDELVVMIDTKENCYSVRDYGRGIPHGKKVLETGEEKEVLEILCTKANSGGKFNNDSYNYSSGLNGLGLTITNALSKKISITSYRDGKSVNVISYGGKDTDLEYKSTKEPNGTLVRFIPDPSMFRSAKVPLDFIKNRCRIASALGFRARLIIDNQEISTDATMFDLITEDNDNVSVYTQIDPIEIVSESGEKMKVAIRYTSETNDRYFGYTNLLTNSLGGTHIQELSKTIINAWKDFIELHKKLKPDTELRPSDYLLGLRGVCAVFISKPEFSSQTKEKLTVHKSYFNEIMSKFKEEFIKRLENDITLAQSLIKRFEEYRISQNKLLARKEISSLIKINTDDSSNIRRRSIVSKLIECTSRKRDNTELFICEGDSAAGPYKAVRNKELQAVLPLRGKILNVTLKDVKDAIKNSEICDIANSMGCGIGSNCDASKSRYERVIISADADPDGLQITCLVLSVFINMFPDMVRQGRVFITTPPLYCWNTKNGFDGCDNIRDIPSNVKNFHRIKGLGEFNDDQLEYFLVNPNTRTLTQVEYPSDIDKFNRILGTSIGKAELMRELGVIDNGE